MVLGIVVFGAAFLAGLGLGTYTRRPLSTAFLVLGSFTALLVLLDSIAGALLENRRATLALEHSHAKVLGEHRAVVNAIAAHDPEAARGAMRTHLHGVEEAWQSQQPPAGTTP